MNWVSEIFKNVTVSKTLTGACCLTGLALLVIPAIFPDILEPLPKIWATAMLGLTVFTGCLQVFWGFSYSKNAILNFFSSKAQKARSKNLSELELCLIYQLGEVVDEWSDIRNIDFSAAPFTKLEILEVCRALEEKGLLKINSFHETMVRLSGTGRIKALELQKESAVSN
ncbi:hypothetical protein [Aliivibrio fischeri]|uniref:Uncharacterized protein n=1 Tax=Aliivibrio fischeri TaxID=668 RepID=A0A510UNX0_ALIFS|nr:hypothetical protein [Aliivibrio fischeri]GEK16239.1 hypothetical protein AFI02nite_42750 [Aliivibrio fischeri]